MSDTFVKEFYNRADAETVVMPSNTFVKDSYDQIDAETDNMPDVEIIGTVDKRQPISDAVIADLLSEFNNVDYRILLQEHYVELGDGMELDSGIMSMLYATYVVNSRRREEILAKTTSTKRNEALVDYLINGPISNFLLFLHVLVATECSFLLDMLKLSSKQKKLVEGMSTWSKDCFNALRLMPVKQQMRTEPVTCGGDDTPVFVPNVIHPTLDPLIKPLPDLEKQKKTLPNSDDMTENNHQESGNSQITRGRSIGDSSPIPTRTATNVHKPPSESESKSQFFFYGGMQTGCMIGDGNIMHIVNGQVIKNQGVKPIEKAENLGPIDASGASNKTAGDLPEGAGGNRLPLQEYTALATVFAAAAYIVGPNISDIFFAKK